MTKRFVAIKDFDLETWQKFLSYLKKKYGTTYGYIPDEVRKALVAYMASDSAQQQSVTSLTSDRSLRADVTRNLSALRNYLSKQFTPEPNTQWYRISDKVLTKMLGEALRRDERTRRRYAVRLKELGYVKLDEEDTDFVFVSASWLFRRNTQQEVQTNDRTLNV